MRVFVKEGIALNVQKSYLLFLVVCMVGGFSSPAISAWEGRNLRFGVEALVPPFESRNAQGELVGLNIELGNALCDELEIQCQWVESPRVS